MKTMFATSWKRSVQPRKQRKYAANAPAHIKGSFLGAHLSKELRTKYGTRAVRVRKGDTVKVLRGSSRGKEGKVERVDVANTLVYVAGLERAKIDGSKAAIGVHPSNLLITGLVLDDKARKAKLEKTTAAAKPTGKAKKKE